MKGLVSIILAAIVLGIISGSPYQWENLPFQFAPTHFPTVSSEVKVFFRNFYHCVLHFHIDTTSEQISENGNWNAYSKLLHFYAGVSPFIVKENENGFENKPNKSLCNLIPRKFLNCTVQLFSYTYQHSDIHSEAVAFQQDFVWLIISKNENNYRNSDTELFVHANFLRLGPASLFFVISNFTKVHMLCLSCVRENRLTNLNTLALNDLQHYNALWLKLHSKLDGITFESNENNLSTLIKAHVWNCNIHKGFYVPHHRCAIYILTKVLNFSVIHKRNLLPNTISHGSVFSLNVVGEGAAEYLADKNLELLNYAIAIKPYAFVMVRDQVPINMLTIVQPFDWQTWIMLIISTYPVALIIWYVLKKEDGFQIWFSTIGLLIDQPASNLNKIIRSPFVSFFCWSLWTFVAFTLNQMYKGSFVSFLLKASSPFVPNTLPLILQTNMLIVTQSWVMNKTIDGKIANVFSLFKKELLSDIMKKRLENGTSIYEQLYKKLEWIGDDNDGDNATVQFLQSNKIFNKHLNKIIEMPDNFFLMDREDFPQRLWLQLKFFTKKWVSNVHPMPIFMYREAWNMKRNYLLPRLKGKLAQLSESGLYNRWTTYWEKYGLMKDLNKTARALGRSRDHDDGNKDLRAQKIIGTVCFASYIFGAGVGMPSCKRPKKEDVCPYYCKTICGCDCNNYFNECLMNQAG
ncbi:unnamed protein product [Orchesella dallaii]|uniref:Uncharacterized protein n=1 Tax=Orchesella dallaii TaxID=48710 RepID=A0ABP1RAF3_9HEXA